MPNSHIENLLNERFDAISQDVYFIKSNIPVIHEKIGYIKETLEEVKKCQKEDNMRINILENQYHKAMGGIGIILAFGVGWVINFIKSLIHS
jgi:hypothetical protein